MNDAIFPLTVHYFMMWTQSTLRFKVIKMVAFQLCLRTVQVMCRVFKAASGLIVSSKQYNEMQKKRHVAQDLNPHRHR